MSGRVQGHFFSETPTAVSTLPGTQGGVSHRACLWNSWLDLGPLLCLRPFPDLPASLPAAISLHLLCSSFSRSWWLGCPISPQILCSAAPGSPSLCPLPFRKLSDSICHRGTWESRRWDGPGNLILTYQDSRVLMGRIKRALPFPLHNPVLRDGQQIGILEFLEGGGGWETRTPESHIWKTRGVREEGKGT